MVDLAIRFHVGSLKYNLELLLTCMMCINRLLSVCMPCVNQTVLKYLGYTIVPDGLRLQLPSTFTPKDAVDRVKAYQENQRNLLEHLRSTNHPSSPERPMIWKPKWNADRLFRHFGPVWSEGDYIGGVKESEQCGTDVSVFSQNPDTAKMHWNHVCGGKDLYKKISLPPNVCGYEETYDKDPDTDPLKMTSYSGCKHRSSSPDWILVCEKRVKLRREQEDTYVTDESRLDDYTRCVMCRKCFESKFKLQNNPWLQEAIAESSKQCWRTSHKEKPIRVKSV